MNAHGPYDVVRLVMKSNMARVFLARDARDGSRVALKVLDAAMDPARFEREALVLASMDHPSIVRYVAHGTSNGKPWLATEWLDGEDLYARIERGVSDLSEVFAIARGAAGALAYLHARGVVHRDVKPGNVFLARGGGGGGVKLLDFGLVRDRDHASMTAENIILGTPQYMAPEQAIDARSADARADVFSLGAVIFHCVTGRPIYADDDVRQLFGAIVCARVPRMSSVATHVPRDLDDLVARMLSRDPDLRPKNAMAFLAELARIREPSFASGCRPKASTSPRSALSA